MDSQKTVTIAGQTFTLERRFCQGGCQRDFWVRPESTSRHARADCEFTCGVAIDQIPSHILSKFDDYYEDTPDELFDFEHKIKGKKKKGISFSIKKEKPSKKTAPKKPKPEPKVLMAEVIEFPVLPMKVSRQTFLNLKLKFKTAS